MWSVSSTLWQRQWAPMSPDGETPLDDLADRVLALYLDADAEMRARWDRSLSFDDTLANRWERAARLGFGSDSSIYGSAAVFGDVSVGEHTWIGPWVLLDGSGGGLQIGAYCSISAGVHVYTHDTVAWSLSAGQVERSTAPVSIGDQCHIGAGSIICAGAQVGTQCVIGAQSFVKGVVPDRAVVTGSPARPIGMVRGEGTGVDVWTGPDAIAALREGSSSRSS